MTDRITQQYSTTDRLDARIAMHERFSRNKQSFYTWIAAHYELMPGMRILEVGCGTGALWRGVTLPEGAHLTLTDLFPAMLDAARESTVHLGDQVGFCMADVQALPFPDASFDLVAANMMMQFVPDTEKALQEIRRVLAPGGRFCAVTLGEHGHNETLLEMLGRNWDRRFPFTLENGAALLERHFAQVLRDDREDALDVTDLDVIVSYLRTLQLDEHLSGLTDADIKVLLKHHMRNGVLTLPKAYGMFIAR